MSQFFVITHTPEGGYTYLTDEWDREEIVFFDTYEDAFEEASNDSWGQEFGFKIFNINEPYCK